MFLNVQPEILVISNLREVNEKNAKSTGDIIGQSVFWTLKNEMMELTDFLHTDTN